MPRCAWLELECFLMHSFITDWSDRSRLVGVSGLKCVNKQQCQVSKNGSKKQMEAKWLPGSLTKLNNGWRPAGGLGPLRLAVGFHSVLPTSALWLKRYVFQNWTVSLFMVITVILALKYWPDTDPDKTAWARAIIGFIWHCCPLVYTTGKCHLEV